MAQVEYFPFAGGLDLVTPPLMVTAGRCLVASNYENDLYGGYRRIAGYERYDGQGSPTTVGAGDPAAIEAQRALIGAVPGSGNILGVWVYLGVVYAFRNNVGGTAAVMYKATNTGWVVVITPALTAGGRYSFVNYNFRGSSSSIMMFGCDGVNKAFQFDGATFTQITTGVTTDAPTHIAAHKKHLFLSFAGGSIQHSSLGDPLTWTPITGASEIAVGDECTGFEQQTGDALAIFTRNQTHMLYGTSSADWNLRPFSRTTGSIAYTHERLGNITYYADDRGVTNLQAVQAFGDFIGESISQPVNPLFSSMKNGGFTTSVLIKRKGQYRLFTDTGAGLSATFSGNQLVGWTSLQFPNAVICAVSGETLAGDEVVYFGSSNGFVYQMEQGASFDGVAIPATLRLHFNHEKSPRLRKRYRRLLLEVEGATSGSVLSYQVEFDSGAYTVAKSSANTAALSGGVAYWNAATWNGFVWSSDQPSSVLASIDGTAKNIGILVYSALTYDLPYKLTGALVHYDPRREDRGD